MPSALFQKLPYPLSQVHSSHSVASTLCLDQFPEPSSSGIRCFFSFSMSLHKCFNQPVTNYLFSWRGDFPAWPHHLFQDGQLTHLSQLPLSTSHPQIGFSCYWELWALSAVCLTSSLDTGINYHSIPPSCQGVRARGSVGSREGCSARLVGDYWSHPWITFSLTPNSSELENIQRTSCSQSLLPVGFWWSWFSTVEQYTPHGVTLRE